MNTGKAVYGILSTNSGVTDLVSTRIFPEIAEQEAATPFIVYQLQSVDPEDTHDGPSKLDEVRFEFICYADTYDTAADVGVKVRAALDRVSGTYNGVNVESVQFNDVDINIEYDPRRYSQVLTFTFRIKRDDFTIAQGTPVTGAQLGQLSDVDVDGVSNGQLIAYNSTSGNWEAADDAGGAERLNDLQDVNFSGIPEDRNVLMYDGEEWVEDNVSKSDVGLGNVDNTSDADKPVSSATQTALNAKADTSAVPTELNDLSDVSISGTPSANEALIFDTATSSFKSLPNFTNRFEDEAENNVPATPFSERVYTVKADGDGIFIDAQSDTPSSGKFIERKIYHKTGFLESGDVIGDFTLIHTFADDTAYSATTSTFEGFRDGDTYGSPPFTLIQTWEEVDIPSLLLDTYTGAAAAYSLRQLRTAYTGDAVRVRRSNDNAEADIGFSNGELDTAALAAHCGSNDGFVKTLYDQSGNTDDATQTSTSNQPKIYDGTTGVMTENGKPTMDFDGSNHYFVLSIGSLNINNMSVHTVCRSDDTSGNRMQFTLGTDANVRYWHYQVSAKDRAYYGAASPFIEYGNMDTDQHLYSFIAGSTSTVFRMFRDGTEAGSTVTLQSGTPLTSQQRLGAYHNNALNWSGTIQEFVLYSADSTNNRTGIESNINTFYSIYS